MQEDMKVNRNMIMHTVLLFINPVDYHISQKYKYHAHPKSQVFIQNKNATGQTALGKCLLSLVKFSFDDEN